MKAFAVCNKGIEDVCLLEIKELTGAKAEIHERAVTFDAKGYEDLCRIAYLGQSMSKVALLLGEFSFGEDFFEKLEENISKSEINDWLHGGITFRAECVRFGEHDFSSVDAAQKAGEAVLRNSGKGIKVNLKNPDVQLLLLVSGNSCHFGIDFAGIDLSNRDYKIFSHRESLNGPVAYSLVRLSGWDGKGILLDPFCGSATIPIEAAFWQTGFPINFYRKPKLAFTRMELGFDQKEFFSKIDSRAGFPGRPTVVGSDMLLSAVNASQKNAKIAGVQKALHVSRIDIEWLDTKFGENSVSHVVTDMPKLTRNTDARFIEKLCREFFHQADFVTKRKGAKIIVVSNTREELEKNAKEHGFKLEKEHELWQGKERIMAYVWGR
jgi:putative N6-adenine-specific DNA methylase